MTGWVVGRTTALTQQEQDDGNVKSYSVRWRAAGRVPSLSTICYLIARHAGTPIKEASMGLITCPALAMEYNSES